MEDATPYANSSQGLYWVGNRLFYYDLPIAHIVFIRPFIGRNYWSVQFNLPFDKGTFANAQGGDTEDVKRDVTKVAKEVIAKIKSYE